MSVVARTDGLGGSLPSAEKYELAGQPEVACITGGLVVVVCAAEGFRMVDGQVAERGVWTAPEEL
jgi:hypothetical protein